VRDDARHLVDIVCNIDDGCVELTSDIGDDAQYSVAIWLIQSLAWLIEDEEARLFDKGSGNQDKALFPLRDLDKGHLSSVRDVKIVHPLLRLATLSRCALRI
jgi:hypothetical protein